MNGFGKWTIKIRPRVYFSFDRENDLDRVCGVVSSVLSVVRPAGEFFRCSGEDHVTSVAQIEHNLEGTAVTVVLIGSNTANCPSVEDELRLSIARENSLLGLYIHQVGEYSEKVPSRGTKPVLPGCIEYPAYEWDGDLKRFAREVRSASRQSAQERRPNLEYFPALGW